MKKFLSILLALAVGFTFTFGSAMSAFAAAKTSYTADEAKALLAASYEQAIASAEAYDEDYDGKYNKYENDITVFTVSKEAVVAGIAAVYDNAIKTPVDFVTSLNPVYDYEGTASSSEDVIKVKKAFLAAAKTATNAAGVKVVDAAAWADYKTLLTGLVDSVDLSVYTETKNEAGIKAKDGETYYTAKEAAAADVAYAKAVINNAKLATNTGKVSATAEWNVNSYRTLYTKVFGDTAIIKIKENKDDLLDSNIVTSLTYVLVGDYATTKSETADAANLAVVQAQAKAALLAAITTYENSSAYNKKQDEQIAAYNEAKTYLIENGEIKNGKPTFATKYSIKLATATDVDGKDYVAISEAAAAAKKALADLKDEQLALGANWDDDAAAKALKTQLLAIYAGKVNTKLDTTGIYTYDLTAGIKAESKIDYSEIEAKKVKGYHGDVYQYGNKAYYEAEWTAVKAAIDTYNAAVDAAKVSKDITVAKAALDKAIDKIKDAKAVYTAVSGATATLANLNAYAKLAYENAHAADATVAAIYVTFGEKTDAIDSNSTLTDEAVYLWFIEKGARTAKEAAALYGDACKVIDAYKTLATIKSESATVVAQIAALPEKPTVADKAAVIAAKDAYDALYTKDYVTNAVKLTAALKTLEKAEAYDVAAKVKDLPAIKKLTVADKAAVKAAKDAYDAYKDTKYASHTYKNTYDFDAALKAIQNIEKDAINEAYRPLYNKWISDKLTADDAAAVKALQDAIAAYIAEYAEALPIEANVEQIADVVNALTVVTNEDVKAYLNTLKVTVKSAKTAKKNVKVTAKVTVRATGEAADFTKFTDAGYTFKYKFYRSTKAGVNYTAKKAKDTTTWTNTAGKKGTKYYYKVKVFAYDKDGNFVGQTYQSQCNYTSKVFGK